MTNSWEKLKDLSSIGIADLSAKGISALFWFYIAALIGPQGYGELTFFVSIAVLASTISLLGATSTLVVYTAKKIPIQTALYSITLISGSISSIVVFLVLFNVGTSFLILGHVIFGLVISELLGQKIFRTYSKFVITQRVLMITLSLGLFYVIGQEGILIGMALSYLPYLIIIIKNYRNIPMNFTLVKEKFGFIINNFIITSSIAINGSLDKLIIGPLFGFTILGNYSLGLQALSLLTMLPTIVSKYIVPYDSSGFENKKLKKIIILISILLSILGFTIGPLALSSIFPKFETATSIIQIVSLSTLPMTIVTVYNSKFLGNEQSRHVVINSSIWTLTQITGIFTLGNIYGVDGIAMSLVLGSILACLYVVIVEFMINKN